MTNETKSTMIELADVRKAIEDEQLTGECPPELFTLVTASIETLTAFAAQVVYATKASIAARLGIELPCLCGKSDCTGAFSPTCGMTETLEQVEAMETMGDENCPYSDPVCDAADDGRLCAGCAEDIEAAGRELH